MYAEHADLRPETFCIDSHSENHTSNPLWIFFDAWELALYRMFLTGNQKGEKKKNLQRDFWRFVYFQPY